MEKLAQNPAPFEKESFLKLKDLSICNSSFANGSPYLENSIFSRSHNATLVTNPKYKIKKRRRRQVSHIDEYEFEIGQSVQSSTASESDDGVWEKKVISKEQKQMMKESIEHFKKAKAQALKQDQFITQFKLILNIMTPDNQREQIGKFFDLIGEDLVKPERQTQISHMIIQKASVDLKYQKMFAQFVKFIKSK